MQEVTDEVAATGIEQQAKDLAILAGHVARGAFLDHDSVPALDHHEPDRLHGQGAYA